MSVSPASLVAGATLLQRPYAQHDDFDFFRDFFLAQSVSSAQEFGRCALEASNRRVHMLHAALVFRHQRPVEQLVQLREQVLLREARQETLRLQVK
jgi:hypothetical protein